MALSLFYVAGMYLNDAFDAEIDARERPERPIPSGQVSAETVFAAGFGMMALGLALLAWTGYGTADGTGLGPLFGGLGLGAAIVLYNRRHKGNPLSPVLMGLCRVLVYVTPGSRSPPSCRRRSGRRPAAVLPDRPDLRRQAGDLGEVRNLWPLLFLAAPVATRLPGRFERPERRGSIAGLPRLGRDRALVPLAPASRATCRAR